MMTGMRTRLTGPMGRIAAVGALALVLAGTVASPATASMKGANAAIDLCFQSGGDPTPFEFAGVWAVGCKYLDGTDQVDTGTRSAVVGVPARGVDHHRTDAHAAHQGRHQAHTPHHHRSHGGKHGKR